jgi:uncharacterized YigZ family protein
MHEDAYSILARAAEVETKVKGSRFLSLAYPLRQEAEALSIRESLAEQYRDASHHCWALKLGEPGTALLRHSDAGEPAGSAGAPIARAIQAANLSDLLVVVIRWFGGTKLGVGGLIRAYGEAAALALLDAERGEYLDYRRLGCRLPFEMEGDLRSLLERSEGHLLKIEYHEEGVDLEIEIPKSAVDPIKENVRNLSRGRHELKDLD